jgi:ABC-type xylose transport system permease subunit
MGVRWNSPKGCARNDVMQTRSRATCSDLVWSWVLGITGLTIIGLYGRVGFILALAPVAIAHRLRHERDREVFENYRGCTACKVFAVLYYVLLLIVVAAESARGVHVIDLPLGVLIGALSFPYVIGMLVADYRTCSRTDRA